jgi:signal transduction histidine kinase
MTMGKEQTRGNIIFNTKDDFIIERDKARVSQAVSNLLNNAIKFTKEGAPMTVERQKMKANLKIS